MYVFENFFFQRWSFFAPPPQSNNRLYYVFQNKYSGKEKAYEVLAPIFDKKRKTAPFNSKEEALDYILSGSATNITDAIRELTDISKMDFPDSTEMYHILSAQKKINDQGLDYLPVRTLYNYAIIMAKKDSINFEGTSIKIITTQVQMPKFKDRHKLLSTTYKGKEEKVFETNFLPLK